MIGAGLLRYRVVIRGYVTALYLERGNASGEVFKDIPKSLVIEYFHAIDAQAFISSTRQGFMWGTFLTSVVSASGFFIVLFIERHI